MQQKHEIWCQQMRFLWCKNAIKYIFCQGSAHDPTGGALTAPLDQGQGSDPIIFKAPYLYNSTR